MDRDTLFHLIVVPVFHMHGQRHLKSCLTQDCANVGNLVIVLTVIGIFIGKVEKRTFQLKLAIRPRKDTYHRRLVRPFGGILPHGCAFSFDFTYCISHVWRATKAPSRCWGLGHPINQLYRENLS
jgi:hypothetical protein